MRKFTVTFIQQQHPATDLYVEADDVHNVGDEYHFVSGNATIAVVPSVNVLHIVKS